MVDEIDESHLAEQHKLKDDRAPNKTVIELKTVPAEMRYNLTEFQVPVGQPVEIMFANFDDIPHNVVIVQKNSLDKIIELSKEMMKNPDAFENHFVPESNLVLAATPLINKGDSFKLQFTAPESAGDYPFVCTFPTHWITMRGVMKVVEK